MWAPSRKEGRYRCKSPERKGKGIRDLVLRIAAMLGTIPLVVARRVLTLPQSIHPCLLRPHHCHLCDILGDGHIPRAAHGMATGADGVVRGQGAHPDTARAGVGGDRTHPRWAEACHRRGALGHHGVRMRQPPPLLVLGKQSRQRAADPRHVVAHQGARA